MIPKVIHFCWLSDDAYPDDISRYLETWHKVLPDYELRLWNFKRFPKSQSAWVAEAFDSRKYAFAADYIRCYALYHEGGIYMDMDVEVLKSFDPLLHLPYFLCFENGSGFVEAGIMASEPGNPIFGWLLQHYDSRHFKRPDGTFDTTTLPQLLSQAIEETGLKIKPVTDAENFDATPGEVSVLPYDYFSPIHNVDCRLMLTDRTMAIHRFAGSWTPWYKRLGRRFKELIGPKLTNVLVCLQKKQSKKG